MANFLRRWSFPAALCAASLIAAGCASIKFMPARYTPETDGHARIAGAKTVVLCAPFDFISSEEHLTYDRRFNPSFYVEDMLQQELQASGVKFVPAKFDCGASFEDVARTLLKAPVVPDGYVVLASAVIWFPDVSTMACDVKVFSSKGALIFEKRGLCVSLCSWWNPKGQPSVPFDASLADDDPNRRKDYESYLRAERNVMRQIFNDPDFQKALK
jgi:hypothetical protein